MSDNNQAADTNTELSSTPPSSSSSSASASSLSVSSVVASADEAASTPSTNASHNQTDQTINQNHQQSTSQSSSSPSSSHVVTPPPLPPRRSLSDAKSDVEPAAIQESDVMNEAQKVARALKKELHTIREQDIEKEHQLWLLNQSREEAFWNKYEERYQTMLKRAYLAERTCRDFSLYTKRSMKLLSVLSDHLQLLGVYGANESSSLKLACMSADILKKTLTTYMTELSERVFSDTINKTVNLISSSSKLRESMESIGADMLKQLRSQRTKVVQLWMSYEQAGAERVRAEQQEKLFKTDPFLFIRQYEYEVNQLKALESKCQGLMNSLLQDLKVEEVKRIECIKQLMTDNLMAQKAVLEHSLKFTDNAMSSVKAIKSSGDVDEWLSNAELMTSESALDSADERDDTASASALALAKERETESISAFMLQPPARDSNAIRRLYAHEIDKEGTIYRQGRIMKSNWHSAEAVVTTSGFLHYFDEKREVGFTLSLHDCKVDLATHVHPHAFVVSQPNGAFFSFGNSFISHYFKAANGDEAMEWMVSLKKYCVNK